MKTKKRYASVLDMVDGLTVDKEFKQELKQEISDGIVAKTLFSMRCVEGLTQADMAKRIGCTQSRLSKLEHAKNDAIKVSDLTAYAEALNLQMTISFHKKTTAVERVKYHAFKIKEQLDHLAQLAHRDDDIFSGVKNFYNEYLQNMLLLFKQSADTLPQEVNESRPVLEMMTPSSEMEGSVERV